MPIPEAAGKLEKVRCLRAKEARLSSSSARAAATLIRHLTGDPPEMAARATQAPADSEELLLADLIVAEYVYVLESFYEVPRGRVAELMRAAIPLPTIKTLDPATLLRALEDAATAWVDQVPAHGCLFVGWLLDGGSMRRHGQRCVNVPLHTALSVKGVCRREPALTIGSDATAEPKVVASVSRCGL